MKKLLIVDGSNLLFQMFYGMPARILGPAGQPIQGTLGFVGALLKIIRMLDFANFTRHTIIQISSRGYDHAKTKQQVFSSQGATEYLRIFALAP